MSSSTGRTSVGIHSLEFQGDPFRTTEPVAILPRGESSGEAQRSAFEKSYLPSKVKKS